MARLFPDYWQGALEPKDSEFAAAHLQACPACQELLSLGENLARLPEEQPSPVLRERFHAMLEGYEEGRDEAPQRANRESAFFRGWSRRLWPHPIIATAAAALLLVAAGFMAGRYLGRDETIHSQEELAVMQSELANMRQLVVLSMLQQDSASQRLQGVSWSARQPKADPMILGALLHTLRYDSSVDVRLAALDALRSYRDQTLVRRGLTEALESQQSPLVQVELIDLLVEWRDGGAVDQLRKMEQDRNLDPAVRERARRAIGELS
jgi:anti-sigma factor RsiW